MFLYLVAAGIGWQRQWHGKHVRDGERLAFDNSSGHSSLVEKNWREPLVGSSWCMYTASGAKFVVLFQLQQLHGLKNDALHSLDFRTNCPDSRKSKPEKMQGGSDRESRTSCSEEIGMAMSLMELITVVHDLCRPRSHYLELC